MGKRVISFICVVLALCTLSAEIITSYEQSSPIIFKNDDRGVSELSSSVNAHLGTLKMIVPQNDKAYSLYVADMARFSYCSIKGPSSWDGSEVSASCNLYAVTKVTGKTNVSRVTIISDYGSFWITLLSTYEDLNLSGCTVTVDFYLKINAGTFYFRENSTLTISTNLSSASVAVSQKKDWPWNMILLPLNGGGGYDDNRFEIIAGGLSGDEIEAHYGDVDDVICTFNIINVDSEKDIDSITGNSKSRIADLYVLVTGPDDSYDLSLTFSDNSGESGFALKNTAGSSLPYALHLGTDEIVKDEAYLGWKDLSEGSGQTRNLYVGNVSSSAVASSLAGIYQDTITVTLQVL